eukprot:10509833-Alexandrium_andersonii.AAC.1
MDLLGDRRRQAALHLSPRPQRKKSTGDKARQGIIEGVWQRTQADLLTTVGKGGGRGGTTGGTTVGTTTVGTTTVGTTTVGTTVGTTGGGRGGGTTVGTNSSGLTASLLAQLDSDPGNGFLVPFDPRGGLSSSSGESESEVPARRMLFTDPRQRRGN